MQVFVYQYLLLPLIHTDLNKNVNPYFFLLILGWNVGSTLVLLGSTLLSEESCCLYCQTGTGEGILSEYGVKKARAMCQLSLSVCVFAWM